MIESTNSTLEVSNATLGTIAFYRMLKGKMKINGIASLIFGFLALSGASDAVNGGLLTWILVLIGLVLLVDGIWLLVSPRALALVIDGIAICAVGLWNVGVSALVAILAGAFRPESHLFILLGVFQIIWGVRTLKQYHRFADAARVAEDPDILQREAIRIAQLVSSDRYAEVWMARTTGKYRAMHYNERELPLDQLLFLLLQGHMDGQRTVFRRPGEDRFRGLDELPALERLVAVLRSSG